MEEFIAKYWAILTTAIMAVLLIYEKFFKIKNDGLETKKSALQLVQEEVKAMGVLIEKKDKEHREELKEKEKEWRESMDKKDKEHRDASEKNRQMIADISTKLAVVESESRQKDIKLKEFNELFPQKLISVLERVEAKLDGKVVIQQNNG